MRGAARGPRLEHLGVAVPYGAQAQRAQPAEVFIVDHAAAADRGFRHGLQLLVLQHHGHAGEHQLAARVLAQLLRQPIPDGAGLEACVPCLAQALRRLTGQRVIDRGRGGARRLAECLRVVEVALPGGVEGRDRWWAALLLELILAGGERGVDGEHGAS